MRITEQRLRSIIREVISEAFITPEGLTVELGSPEHIAELQRELDELAFIRDRYSRTSKQRERMTRAMGAVRDELKKAKRLSKLLQDGDT
jgi:hypothetical protein